MIGTPRVSPTAAPTRPTSARASWRLAGAPHGTLVTAGEQTAGPRAAGAQLAGAGRQRAADVARDLRDFGAADVHLPLAAAVAVCDAVRASGAT